MALMKELKSFDNVISAIDYLYLNLKENPMATLNFDLERLRKIGIEACDRESNTYLWHINALIHASSDLKHLILGLEIMFDRFLKSKKVSLSDINIDSNIDSNIDNENENENDIDNDMIDQLSENEDRSNFVKLKSRSTSHSPQKMIQIEKSFDSPKKSNKSKYQQCHKIDNSKYQSNEIRKNEKSDLLLGMNNTNNNNNKKNGSNGVDYIAQLLLSPEPNYIGNMNRNNSKDSNKMIQSSPNARQMKRIKRIRQQERKYQAKVEKEENNGLTQSLQSQNDESNHLQTQNSNNDLIMSELSPFEIGKFVRQVDQSQK